MLLILIHTFSSSFPNLYPENIIKMFLLVKAFMRKFFCPHFDFIIVDFWIISHQLLGTVLLWSYSCRKGVHAGYSKSVNFLVLLYLPSQFTVYSNICIGIRDLITWMTSTANISFWIKNVREAEGNSVYGKWKGFWKICDRVVTCLDQNHNKGRWTPYSDKYLLLPQCSVECFGRIRKNFSKEMLFGKIYLSAIR